MDIPLIKKVRTKGKYVRDTRIMVRWKDVEKAERSKLVKEMRPLVDLGNKRIKRIVNAGMEGFSEPVRNVLKEGKFSTKGKDLNALKHELARLEAFLNKKTSTLGGANAFRNELQATFARMTGITDPSDERMKIFFDAIHSVEDLRRDIFGNKNYKAELQAVFYKGIDWERFEQMQGDERVKFIIEKLTQEQQMKEKQFKDIFSDDPLEFTEF